MPVQIRPLSEADPSQSVILNSGSTAPAGQGAYQSLYDSNPYSGLDYRQSPWQNFLTHLGFRTEADAWKENNQMQQNEYNAQIALKQYDEAYNSPTAQVARMKAAGLNPDISGGDGIDSGSAAALGEDPSTPMQTTGDEGTIMQVANGVMSAMSTAIGMIGSFQGIHRAKLENSILAIQEQGAMKDFASGLSLLMLPNSSHPEGIQNYDWRSVAIQNAEQFAGKLPKNLQQSFIDYQTRFFNSAPGEGESMEAFRERVKSTKGLYSEESTFWSEIQDVMSDIYNNLGSMAEKIYSQNQKTELAESEASEAGAKTEESYQNALDGSLMGTAQNSANLVEKETNDTLGILRESVSDIVSGLKRHADNGGIKGGLASVALALLSGLQLWLSTQGAPTISRSQSSGSSQWNKNGGYSTHSSGSFSIGF